MGRRELGGGGNWEVGRKGGIEGGGGGGGGGGGEIVVLIRHHAITLAVFLLLRNAYHGASPYCTALTALGSWNYQIPCAFGIHHVRL